MTCIIRWFANMAIQAYWGWNEGRYIRHQRASEDAAWRVNKARAMWRQRNPSPWNAA
jgi:hypothetical protein